MCLIYMYFLIYENLSFEKICMTCNSSVNNVWCFYRCQCLVGFTGHQCDININDCDPNPCVNATRCEDSVNGFICHCSKGFSGERCERGNECFEIGKIFLKNVILKNMFFLCRAWNELLAWVPVCWDVQLHGNYDWTRPICSDRLLLDENKWHH